MSELEQNEVSRVKGRNVIQYTSEQINGLDSGNTMEGIKTITTADRKVREAILAHEAELEQIVDSRNSDKSPTITGVEAREGVKQEFYR